MKNNKTIQSTTANFKKWRTLSEKEIVTLDN